MQEEKIQTLYPLGKSGRNISKQNYEIHKKEILLALREKELAYLVFMLKLSNGF